MPSVPAYVQEISINRIRKEGMLVLRGYVLAMSTSGMALVFLIWWIVGDLSRFDAAKLVTPAPWVCAGAYVLSAFAMRACSAPFCKRCLAGLFALQALLLLTTLLAARTVLPGIRINFAIFAQVGRDPIILLPPVLVLLWLYYLALSPAIAAIRLLATRLPPDDVPVTTVMATLKRARKRPRARTRLAARAQALKAIALLTLITLVVVSLRTTFQLIETEDEDVDLLAFLGDMVLFVPFIFVIPLLWRRGQRLEALDANEALKHDPRPPILYLRSFQDDSELLGDSAGLFLQVGSGAPSTKLEGARAQAFRRILQTGQGRLEESLAWDVRGIGPFVAIGAPTEALPQLGAARAYLSDNTWQSTVIRWVDLAGLIILAIGPTKWIRWELDTIVERDALSKLVILMPAGRPEDRAARWQQVTSGLQQTRWGSSLAMVDSDPVIAIRFIDDGGLSIVTGGKRGPIDYLLAFRLMLYQMKKSAQ
jgi:hypothetical protein